MAYYDSKTKVLQKKLCNVGMQSLALRVDLYQPFDFLPEFPNVFNLSVQVT
jgi:hypothetical protein